MMLLRLLRETLQRRKKRVATAMLAVLLGSSLATALLSVSADATQRVGQELRSYGANILLVPKSDTLQVEVSGITYTPPDGQNYIDENELGKLKTIFWRNNILGFTPYLSAVVKVGIADEVVLTGTWFAKDVTVPAGGTNDTALVEEKRRAAPIKFTTGVKSIAPWWRVRGAWVAEDDEEGSIVGTGLSERLGLDLGSRFTVHYKDEPRSFVVSGIVSTGGFEDNQIFVNLPAAQQLLGLHKGANKVLVSALTMPREKLPADIRNKKTEEMTPQQYEKWYCSPVIEAIVKQIQEVNSTVEVKPIRQISEAEGSFLTKIQLLILLVTVVALVASALGVATTMTTLVLERQSEIGLMKAIGADDRQVAVIFLSEAALIGLAGGVLGYLAGLWLTQIIGAQVFQATISTHPAVLPITLALAVGVALAGSAIPVRKAVSVDPALLLKGS